MMGLKYTFLHHMLSIIPTDAITNWLLQPDFGLLHDEDHVNTYVLQSYHSLASA